MNAATAPAAELPPLKIASVADDGRDDLDDDASADHSAATPTGQLDLPSLPHTDAHLDELCERLAWWASTRRLWGAPRPRPDMQIGKLVKRTRALHGEPPDAACNAQLAALWIALVAQPAESIDRIVFELHYLHRVANVKYHASIVGIGRQHWYTLLRDFRRRIYAASCELLSQNLAEGVRTLSRSNSMAAPTASTGKMSPVDATSSCSPTGDTLAQNSATFC